MSTKKLTIEIPESTYKEFQAAAEELKEIGLPYNADNLFQLVAGSIKDKTKDLIVSDAMKAIRALTSVKKSKK
jgi:hypothetical protein